MPKLLRQSFFRPPDGDGRLEWRSIPGLRPIPWRAAPALWLEVNGVTLLIAELAKKIVVWVRHHTD